MPLYNYADTPLASPTGLLRNQLLAALNAEDASRWHPLLERVELSGAQVLNESGVAPAHVYFPTTAIVSLLYTTAEGECTETGVVGCDGLVGISVFMGGNGSLNQAVVQSPGEAWRLPARIIRDECGRSRAVLQMMLGYTQAMLGQVARTAACYRYHSIDQLLCRRLMLGLERSPGTHLFMTQESAANLLGVRREGVTGAALKLQEAGVINYRRGRISVLDRPQLEAGTRCLPPRGRSLKQFSANRAAATAQA